MSDLGLRLISVVGLAAMVFFAWLLSYDRKAFPWRIVLIGTAMQLTFGVIVLRTDIGFWFFSVLNDGVTRLLTFTDAGSEFLFGDYLHDHFTIALNVLPTIIFFSSLMTVLYHLGVMQRIVLGIAWVMQRTLKTSGAETLAAAANIFVGQTEAPLVVKPFVGDMTKSELMAVMVGGFGSVAGGVMAAYVGMLHNDFPNIAGHLLSASVLSAPAGLLMAKVLLPEAEVPRSHASLELDAKSPYENVIDAAATGAADGLKLALNVAAMLLAFMALVALLNWLFAVPAMLHNRAVWDQVLGLIGQRPIPEGCVRTLDASPLAACIAQANELDLGTHFVAWEPWTMQRILGVISWPMAFLMGVPVEDCDAVARLLSERLVLNEFVAYMGLAENLNGAHPMSERASTIVAYALCGFANFSSIAIQIGGIGALAPERRGDLARLGLRAMIGGMLATYMTACVAGILA